MEDWHPVLVIVAASFIPTLAGFAVLFMGTYKLNPFLFIPAGAAAVFGLQAYACAMYKYYKERRLKRLTVFAVALALILITPYTVYAIITPNWSFKVSTDKTVYKLGENVTITATLTNNGYVTHSFATGNESVYIDFRAEYQHGSYVRWGSYERLDRTVWSLVAGQSIREVAVWNQITMEGQHYWDYTIVPINRTGDYYISAEIHKSGYMTVTYLRDSTTITIEP